tara:strand:+ start:617 stop:760 length:144 start_codon:yes stop_codon:yes gene_type:complete
MNKDEVEQKGAALLLATRIFPLLLTARARARGARSACGESVEVCFEL